MREVGVAWFLWMLALGGSGFAIGFLVVVTMPAPALVRLGAAGLVLAALVLAAGLNVVGLLPPPLTLYGVFLIPVLAAVGLRRRFTRLRRTNGLPRGRALKAGAASRLEEDMTSETFPSKVDGWLAAALLAGGGVALVGGLVAAGALVWPIAFLMLAVGCVLPVWLLVSTDYTLTGDQLLVKAGPFRWRVPIREIRSVAPTRSPVSSPALSLDRLRIEYGDSKAILVSPRNQARFLEELEARRADPV